MGRDEQDVEHRLCEHVRRLRGLAVGRGQHGGKGGVVRAEDLGVSVDEVEGFHGIRVARVVVGSSASQPTERTDRSPRETA